MQLYLKMIIQWSQEGSFQTQFSVCKTVFFPSAQSWILCNEGNNWKSAISSTTGRDGIFAKSLRRDPLRQSCKMCKSLNVQLLLQIERSHLQRFAHVTRIPWRDGRGESCCLNPREAAKTSTKDQVSRLHPPPSLISSWCGDSRNIRDYWSPWGVSSLPKAAACDLPP